MYVQCRLTWFPPRPSTGVPCGLQTGDIWNRPARGLWSTRWSEDEEDEPHTWLPAPSPSLQAVAVKLVLTDTDSTARTRFVTADIV